jgi:hypothetical protein
VDLDVMLFCGVEGGNGGDEEERTVDFLLGWVEGFAVLVVGRVR